MSEVLVIGHRNPDTDAICSAIGYADFRRRTGLPEAVAARCGDTNDRINFVLSTFGVPAPRFVTDVSPKIRDVMQTNVVSVRPGATVAEVLAVMDDRNIRVLPVLDDEGKCRGLVSVFKMSKFFLPSSTRPFDSRRVLASIRDLAKTLNAKMLFSVEPDREEDLVLMIGAMTLEHFSKRLPNYPPDKIVLVVGDRADIQWLAIEKRVRVVTCDFDRRKSGRSSRCARIPTGTAPKPTRRRMRLVERHDCTADVGRVRVRSADDR